MAKIAAIAVEGQTKICPKCGRDLSLSEYNKGNGKYGKRSICRSCEHDIQTTPAKNLRRRTLELSRRENPEYVLHRNQKDAERRHNNENSIKLALLHSARIRSRRDNLPFNLTVEDIELPEYCPLLEIKLVSNKRVAKGNSFSLDKIIPSLGYVKGNVWTISNKANRIKSDASLEELELITKNLSKYWIH